MAEVIRERFIRGRHSSVVAGTHGKTTTTSLLAWVMEVGGLDPSFLIGGVAENFGASFRLSASRHFVIEGDEYDTAYFDKGAKFLHYLPELVILNNVEYDHADIYGSLEEVKRSFRLLINLIPGEGRLVAGWDSPVVRELVEHPVAPQGVWSAVETFGVDREDAKWRAVELDFAPESTAFTVLRAGEVWGRVRTPLAGRFNVRNCLGVIAAAEVLGVRPAAVREALASFRSVRRRMEVRGIVGDIVVIDDFAHHPTAIRETLLAIAQRYPGRRLVAVFEPRSWTARKKVFQDQYLEAFAPAAHVVIASVFESHRLAAEDRLSVPQLVDDLRHTGREAFSLDGAEAIVAHLCSRLAPGDVVAIMSNGGFDNIHTRLIEALATSPSGGLLTDISEN